MAKKDWQYMLAGRGNSVGRMICTRCNEKITQGWFKYRQDNEGCFVSHQHQACSTEDPRWDRMKREEATRRAGWQEYLTAMVKFKNDWGTNVLDQEIEDYAELLKL